VTLWVAWWWMAEPVENPFASLVPLAVLPLAGVLTGKQVALAYGDPLILLLAGGFMLSAAVERSGVHRRLALLLLSVVGGGSGARIVVAFALATALLSMWVSNTAATLMMLPVALAVCWRATRTGASRRR
jgi:sodium-dependent dicarboxylate transporter 2/3/5